MRKFITTKTIEVDVMPDELECIAELGLEIECNDEPQGTQVVLSIPVGCELTIHDGVLMYHGITIGEHKRLMDRVRLEIHGQDD